MVTKKTALDAINKLPNTFSIDDLIDRLIFIEKVERGLKESDERKTFTKSEAKNKLKKWLK